eukprot:255196-Amphidinium_carterae.1
MRYALILGRCRCDLADAIADNIVLVAIKQRVLELGDGDLFRELLPKAIVDVANEHGHGLVPITHPPLHPKSYNSQNARGTILHSS